MITMKSIDVLLLMNYILHASAFRVIFRYYLLLFMEYQSIFARMIGIQIIWVEPKSYRVILAVRSHKFQNELPDVHWQLRLHFFGSHKRVTILFVNSIRFYLKAVVEKNSFPECRPISYKVKCYRKLLLKLDAIKSQIYCWQKQNQPFAE